MEALRPAWGGAGIHAEDLIEAQALATTWM